LALEDVCDALAGSLLVIVEFGGLPSGGFAILIICASVEVAEAANVQISTKNANGRVLL